MTRAVKNFVTHRNDSLRTADDHRKNNIYKHINEHVQNFISPKGMINSEQHVTIEK